MPGFDVTTAELAGGASFTADAQESLAGELERIAALVEDVLSTSWRGDAATAFSVAWSEWAAGARDVLSALHAMSESLRATGATYAAAEHASLIVL